MLLKELLKLEEVEEAEGDLNREVSGLAYDSRNVRPGQIFFAIPGEKADGHDFVAQAVARGASAVVVVRKTICPRGIAEIRVRDVRRAMGVWSAHFFGRPSRQLQLVGVTGTNGKTTVTYLVESILSAAGMEPGVIGTINYRYHGHQVPSHHTTPESLDLEQLLAEMHRAGVTSVVMEVSSHALAQERVRGLDFDVGVFTNLSRDHLDYHADMDDYFSAKSRLFTDYLTSSAKPKKAAVIYAEDPRGKGLLSRVRDAELEVWSYGEGDQWDIHPLSVQYDVRGVQGRLRVKDRSFEFSSHLIGAANLQNIMAAVGVGQALGISADAIAEGIRKLAAVPGRLEKIENDLGISVLVDYAHTPDALEKVLQALRGILPSLDSPGGAVTGRNKTPSPKLISVFGCGGDRDRGKRPLMGAVAARLSDLVILTSDNPRTEDPLRILAEIEPGVRKTGFQKLPVLNSEFRLSELERGYWVEADRRKAIRMALQVARSGDLVLIAGKGHEDYQILEAKRIHFDDREVAREELARIKNEIPV